MSRPWMLGHEDCIDPWDAYGYWESWVRRHIPEHCRNDWDECPGALQANLYGLMCDLAAAVEPLEFGAAEKEKP